MVTDGDDPARFAAVVEWRRPRWSVEESRFELSVEVDPADRQRGLGSMLLARALATVPSSRPAVVEIWTREDRPDAVRFLERRGFRLASRHAISELDLARFDPARFEPEVRRVKASGVTLHHLGDGRCADVGLLRRLYDLQATDALLYTGLTGVARSHRHRGLATELKVLALGCARGRRAASGRPPVVRTGNAETNPMLGINLRLGFTGRPASLRFALERAPGSAGGWPRADTTVPPLLDPIGKPRENPGGRCHPSGSDRLGGRSAPRQRPRRAASSRKNASRVA